MSFSTYVSRLIVCDFIVQFHICQHIFLQECTVGGVDRSMSGVQIS
jgi:hypothetical protein